VEIMEIMDVMDTKTPKSWTKTLSMDRVDTKDMRI
jgi:hypothetical protein